MFKLLKKNKTPPPPVAETKHSSLLERLKSGLSKTRHQFTDSLSNLLLGKKELDAEVFDSLETQLLLADVGIETTQHLIAQLSQQLKRNELNDSAAALALLKKELLALLEPCQKSLDIASEQQPFLILVVGVNGAGKTTTIAKLAHYWQQQGKKLLLAAGDTFRAAATEQLQIWGERHQIPVIAQQPGADPASVIYDAFAAAKARKVDILLADTAGRLHTQAHLMAELKKIKRVLTKLDPTAPHETLLVLDASIGQNALTQAKQFHEAMGITGLVVTKLDGTAKGGVIFAIAQQLKIPIRFIGLGEKNTDLRPFDAEEFITALFD